MNLIINQHFHPFVCTVASRWPRTLAGFKAYLPCNRLPSSGGLYSGGSGEEQRAWRSCNSKGVWAEDDYTRCQFQKDVTRFLYVINQVCSPLSERQTFALEASNMTSNLVCPQMPLNESNVVAKARRLLVYTIDAANFSDKMDIIFVAEMIEKIGKFVEKFKDVRRNMKGGSLGFVVHL